MRQAHPRTNERLWVQGGGVGAAVVLSPERQESFAVDLASGAEATADELERILEDTAALQHIAERASVAARGYDDVANARLLMADVQEHLLQADTTTATAVGTPTGAITVAA